MTAEGVPVPGSKQAGRIANLRRIRARMDERGLDAYLAFTPSNVAYVTGFSSFFLSTSWRAHGTVLAAVQANPGDVVALMVGDAEASGARAVGPELRIYEYATWVELGDVAKVSRTDRGAATRPSQYSEEEQDALIAQLLRDIGVTEGRVGTDLRHITHDTLSRLQKAAPAVVWEDFGDEMYEIRSIKAPFEVEALRSAIALAEMGVLASISTATAGMRVSEFRNNYLAGVAHGANTDRRYEGFSDAWVIPACGRESAFANGEVTSGGLRAGDLIKFDCGTTVDGYRSDMGRTFVFGGRPTAADARLFSVLHEAFLLAVAEIRPGRAMSSLFKAASTHIHDAGYPGYIRGHFGHSVGLDTFVEEPPYLSTDNETLFEEGMVLAVETPFYGSERGAILIEDLLLVTVDGAESLNQLPRDLVAA